MKILYITPHFYPHIGGGEQAFLDTMYNLKELHKDCEVRVVTSASAGIEGKHSHMGIDIYSYPWKIFLGHPIVSKKDLIEHINWCDIVHVGVYSPVRPAVAVAHKLHKRIIVTAHESINEKWYWVEPNRLKAFMLLMYEKYVTTANCDLFHVPSEATLKDLKKNNPNANIKRIYWISDNKLEHKKVNKQDFYQAFDIDNTYKTFLYYGRPGQTKGIFVYEKAIKILKEKLREDELKKIKFCFIISKDPLKGYNQLKNNIDKHNLNDIIKIRTDIKRNDLLHFIECTDYVVVPSITEGFGLSAIEACERNTPLIASNGGSLPEVTYGRVCEFINRDSSDLADKLLRIIRGEDIFVYKEKKDFTRKTVIDEFYKMYESVLKK